MQIAKRSTADQAGPALHYISYLDWLKYKTAKPLLYTVYRTKTKTENRKKIIEKKREVLRRFRKTVNTGAEVTSGSRLLQRHMADATP